MQWISILDVNGLGKWCGISGLLFFYFCRNLKLRIFIFCSMPIIVHTHIENIVIYILIWWSWQQRKRATTNDRRDFNWTIIYWLCRFSCNNIMAKHWKKLPQNPLLIMENGWTWKMNIWTFFSSLSFSFRVIHSWKK